MKFSVALVWAPDKMTRWLQEKRYSVTPCTTNMTVLMRDGVSFRFTLTNFARFISLTEQDMTDLSLILAPATSKTPCLLWLRYLFEVPNRTNGIKEN